MGSEGPIVEALGLEKRYGELCVLRDVSIAFRRGTLTSIVGPSGAGKSTLLQIIGSLLTPSAGRVLCRGVDIYGLSERQLAGFRNSTIGFVFQFHHLLPECTALENITIPALIGGGRYSQVKGRALELLELVGLPGRATHKPAELSGGEQQRVAVCRALINDPPIILADEPSGNLDTANREGLHDLFFQLRDTLGKTLIIVTHDESLAQRADRVVHMRDGRVYEDIVGSVSEGM